MTPQIRAKLEFLDSIKRKYPRLYTAAVKRGGQLAGLGITQAEMLAEQDAFAEPVFSNKTTAPVAAQPWYKNYLDSAVQTVKDLAPAYVGLEQAKTCIKINADRAKQGLSPVDCAGLAPQVSVGVSPDVKTFMYIGLGVAGIIGLMMFMKKR